MPQFTVIVSEEELKALEWDIYDVQEWIQNAISEKARRAIDILVEQKTDRNPRKVTLDGKLALVRAMTLETAKERTDRFKRELGLE